jgi:hypothetical protein
VMFPSTTISGLLPAVSEPNPLIRIAGVAGDSDESDHSIPGQADYPFRGKLTRVFRAKVTTVIV